jgi:predicted neuraminidase
MLMLRSFFLLGLAAWLFAAAPESGFVAQSDGAEFHNNNIPQVARLGDGRLLCVFGVSPKSGPSGRVYGAFSADGARTWSKPQLLFSSQEYFFGDANILVDGDKVFVYATRVTRPNRIEKAWTFVIRSGDNGQTWSQPEEIHIPRQYTPGKQHNGIVLADGTYAMGISWDLWAEQGMAARTEGEMVLASGLLKSRDGLRWTLHGNLTTFIPKMTPGSTNGLCEPAIVQLADGEIWMVLRSGGSHHWESRSVDGGATWSEPRPSVLVGHNTPTALLRLAGLPHVVAAWNQSPVNRFPLVIAISADGGRKFSTPKVLANPIGYQASYPGLTQTRDGVIVAVWQQQRPDGGRDVRWARLTREWLEQE